MSDYKGAFSAQITYTVNDLVFYLGVIYRLRNSATAGTLPSNTAYWKPESTASAGPQGPEGKSAYQVAVENGFSGDETAWLASLVGSGEVFPSGFH